MSRPGIPDPEPLLISAACQIVPLPLEVPDPEPLPEPLAALALYWNVMLVIGTSTVRSAPSTLAVKLL
jgi:hypothetical protein